MALSTLKRMSRVLSPRDEATDTADNCDASSQPDNAHILVDGQLQSHHRSSPKASMYEHSPTHSATTLHDLEHVPTDLPRRDSSDSSDAIVQVLTIGDSVITVETHRRDDEEVEQAEAKRRRKSFGLRRVKTAPPTSRSTPLHGSITTIESVHTGSRLRAWSYPLVSWKDLNLVRRMRRSVDLKEARKEARKGKVSCESESDPQSLDGANVHATAGYPLLMMSGAYQESPSNMGRPRDEPNISPRTSACLNSGPDIPGQRGDHRESSREEHIKRKDSHVNNGTQTKEKAAAEMKANTRKLSSDERSSSNMAFLLHPINWIRQYHASVSDPPDSGSSSSDSSPPSPTTQPSRPARRTEETHATQPRPSQAMPFRTSTRDGLHLPPGLEPPVAGQAGPADWLHRGWEEHYRRSAEASRRACHPLAAARSLPTSAEAMQRYNPGSTCKDGYQQQSAQRVNSTPEPPRLYTQSWDFAVGGKGKGVRDYRCAEDGGAERRRVRRSRSQGACVTTLTLGECIFPKEIEQTAA
jgi:hypothetical protein